MRKYYIDNIRILCILLLFPFHACVIYNAYGEAFYVTGEPVKALSEFIIAVYPWWMTLLFTIAGISSAYALKKRSGGAYIRERIHKMLIPLLSGLLFIIPIQSYIADVSKNGYTGGYLRHYGIFFTKFTDLTGYDGGFTLAHTWFMLYLFIISMGSLPFMLWYNKRDKKIDGKKITIPVLLSMFPLILLMTPIFETGGKSFGESLACFLLGFYFLSHDEVQERLMKYRIPLGIAWIILMVLRCLFYSGVIYSSNLLWDIEQRVLTWIGILAVLGLGKKYLNFNNKFTKYFSTAAFPIYYFHQSILIVIAFFTLKMTDDIPMQFSIILVLSFVFTLFCYEICSRFTVTCFMFGLKKKSNLGLEVDKK